MASKMFYIDLRTVEENSTNADKRRGFIGASAESVDKRYGKLFDLPIEWQYNTLYQSKSSISYPSSDQGVDADEENTCHLPPPMQRNQDSQTMEQSGAQPKPSESENESDAETWLRKRTFVLRELIATEESYVKYLSLIVDGYIREMNDPKTDIPMPDDLKGGKDRLIFGNVEAIYEWHRDIFLKPIQGCMHCPSDLGPFIQKCEPKLRHLYVIYCQNKPLSEHIVVDHLGYFEELCDLLIKPVQRIMKYELLLRDYVKYTERGGLVNEIPNIQAALNVMKEVPEEANVMMDIGRLQKFEGKITAQGKLLLHGRLLCTDVDSNNGYPSIVCKPKEFQVFLFEQSLILSEIVGEKTQFTNPSYVYKAHIQVNNMKIKKLGDNRFLLGLINPQRRGLSYMLTTKTRAQYREWVDHITNLLQKQLDFLNAIQDPIAYQKEVSNESCA